MNLLFGRAFLASLVAFVLTGCGHSSVIKRDKAVSFRTTATQAQRLQQDQSSSRYLAASYGGVFPKPASLEPAVDFWRKTYAVWRRSDIAYHDDRYLDVVYEVVQFPGYVAEGLTNEQKKMLNDRRDYWKQRLAELENKLLYHVALNADDQRLLDKLKSSGRPLNTVLPGASERVRAQRGTRERFKRGLEISGRYNLQFRKIFRDAGLPEDLAYLPHVESSFQPSARSSAGAVGMWQFTKAAADTFMPGGGSIARRLDPFISAQGAARYLSYAYGKLGDWPTALTSYNHGIGGMKRAQNQMGTDFIRVVDQYDGPAFGFASRNYYAQFLAAREISNKPEVYFTEGVNYEIPAIPTQYLAAE